MQAFETWDLTQSTFPPRSRLYQLAPIGVGTPWVESLTSYLTRLADAHSVFPGNLIGKMIGPALSQAYIIRRAERSLGGFYINAAALNGGGKPATYWVQGLQALTLQRGLNLLTLLPWAGVFSPRSLLRPQKAWCPACYEEWEKSGQTPYDPLLWSLQVVSICPLHGRRLTRLCPSDSCQHSLLWLEARSRPGHCSHCAGWLGIPVGAELLESEQVTEEELIRQRWVVEQLGELFANTPALAFPPTRRTISDAFTVCIQQVTKGNVSAFVRVIQMPEATVRDWYAGKAIPPLDVLLWICQRLGISLREFLEAGPVMADAENGGARSQQLFALKTRVRRKPVEVTTLKQRLEAILNGDESPPPSLREVSRRLGASLRNLYNHFPEFCQAISARYMAYRQESKRQRSERLQEEVRQLMLQFHTAGIYPSHNAVGTLLKPGYFRDRSVHAAWLQVRRELEMTSEARQ